MEVAEIQAATTVEKHPYILDGVEVSKKKMSLSGLVQETDVAGLGVDDLRRVLNRLLSIEASIHRVPIANLHLTLREYDSDGGIDARVIWPASAQHDVLLPGENVFQYKTGKIGEAGIRSEFNKCGVQNSLKNGGHYHLLVGQDYNPPNGEYEALVERDALHP